MGRRSYYKYCVVPKCSSNSKSTPTKLFIYVPKEKEIRKQWLQLAKRNPSDTSLNSVLHFCEDHFDLPNDMRNYMRYHVMGSVKKKLMKDGCLPSKFECQTEHRKRISSSTLRSIVIERKRMTLVQEALDATRKFGSAFIETDNTVSNICETGSTEDSEQNTDSSNSTTSNFVQVKSEVVDQIDIKEEPIRFEDSTHFDFPDYILPENLQFHFIKQETGEQ